MSDSNSSNQLGISSELLRWLRLLELPLWARTIVFGMMIVVVAGGLAMLVYGISAGKDDIASRAMQLITLSLPVLVVVLALVFGQNSDAKLRKLTHKLLAHDLPNALRLHLGDAALQDIQVRGCRALYRLQASSSQGFCFQVELNVYKVNVVLEVPKDLDVTQIDSPSFGPLSHALQGALAEGYILNPSIGTLQCSDNRVRPAITLYRSLSKDFLLEPAQRLYFMQDLCFFIGCIGQVPEPTEGAIASTPAPSC